MANTREVIMSIYKAYEARDLDGVARIERQVIVSVHVLCARKVSEGMIIDIRQGRTAVPIQIVNDVIPI